MEGGLEQKASEEHRQPIQVSILVLVEGGLERGRGEGRRNEEVVSILVLVEGGLERGVIPFRSPFWFTVSILVLVEGGLELACWCARKIWHLLFQSLFWWRGGWNSATTRSWPRRPASCFNPCFGGGGVGTDRFPAKDRSGKLVSILVLVEGGLER